MRRIKVYLLLGVFGLSLWGCRNAGEEVPGTAQKNTEDKQNKTEQITEPAIELTAEQMNESHLDMNINDKISVSAYLTPYGSYKDGVNIYQALSNKNIYSNDCEAIVKEVSAQTNKSFTHDYTNEAEQIYGYTSDDGMVFGCSENEFSYTDKDASGEIAYYGFGVSHKNPACQGKLRDELLYAEKIKNIEALTKTKYFNRVEIYNYDTLTSDNHIYENFIAENADAGITMFIEDNGYEYAVLFPIVDNLAYKYQGVIYKKTSYNTYNNNLFSTDPYNNNSAASSNFVNHFRVCYDSEKLTNLTVDNSSIPGEKISTEKVINANEALQIALGKLGNVKEKVLITSIELCYDVKLYVHDGMLDGKYYPYWIVNYYDYSLEFRENDTFSGHPAEKFIIDAVNGTVIERTRCNLTAE